MTEGKKAHNGNITKWRNRCRKSLKLERWYRYKFVAEALGDDELSFKQTIDILSKVADFETDGKHQIMLHAIKEVKKYTPLTEEQRKVKREKRKAREAIIPRVQYTKCVRALIEKHQTQNSNDLTYKSLTELYLKNPVESFYVTNSVEFNDCLSKAIRSQIGWDMYNIDKTKSTANKKYLIKDLETGKSRKACAAEITEIEEVFESYGMKYTNNLTFTDFNRAKEEINERLDNAEFICTAFEIKYTSSFLHSELYTPEIIQSRILRKWDYLINYEIRNLEKPQKCWQLYEEWSAEYIQPYLLPNDGAEKGES